MTSEEPVLEYRIKWRGDGEDSGWISVGTNKLNFDTSLPHLENLQVRIRPKFEPGYYRKVGADRGPLPAIWRDEDPGADYVPVDVVPRESE